MQGMVLWRIYFIEVFICLVLVRKSSSLGCDGTNAEALDGLLAGLAYSQYCDIVNPYNHNCMFLTV